MIENASTAEFQFGNVDLCAGGASPLAVHSACNYRSTGGADEHGSDSWPIRACNGGGGPHIPRCSVR